MVNNKRKYFIIGSTGFVGSRLVERLFLKYSIKPYCLVRNYSSMVRISRFPVNIVHGDLLNTERFKEQIKDCDIYVFSAHGKEKEKNVNWRIDTEGLEKVLKIAVENRIKHFIYLSTSAIYEKKYENGIIDESINVISTEKDYAGGKIQGENLCLKYSKDYNLPVTILRPTIVYGPYAPSFTVYPAELIKNDAVSDFGNFRGTCNLIYIDDLVDVIIHCMENKKAIGEAFIISHGELIRWIDFFNEFSKAIKGQILEKQPVIKFYVKAIPLRIIKETVKLILKISPDFTKKVYHTIKKHGTGNWSWIKGNDTSSIDIRFFQKDIIFKVDKMKKQLKFEPAYSFEKGFGVTREWLKHHNYIPDEHPKK